jgi:hypothetical protein
LNEELINLNERIHYAWKYNTQYGDEISLGPGGHKMMNGIYRHAVSLMYK